MVLDKDYQTDEFETWYGHVMNESDVDPTAENHSRDGIDDGTEIKSEPSERDGSFTSTEIAFATAAGSTAAEANGTVDSAVAVTGTPATPLPTTNVRKRKRRKDPMVASCKKEDNSHRDRASGSKNLPQTGEIGSTNDHRVEWLRRIGKELVEFHRLRILKNRGPNHDRNGRLPGLWCLERGYVAACARVFANEAIHTSEDAIQYLGQGKQTIKRNLTEWNQCNWNGKKEGTKTKYCNGYIRFGLMPKDSIVAMLLPKGEGKSEEAMVYFGFVESDEVILRTKDELRDEDFPYMHLFDEVEDFSSNRLMLRKVQWMRKGCVRDLRALQSLAERNSCEFVKWLLENHHFWNMEVKTSNKSTALEVMKGESFWDKTQAL